VLVALCTQVAILRQVGPFATARSGDDEEARSGLLLPLSPQPVIATAQTRMEKPSIKLRIGCLLLGGRRSG
jgi:hypothetical protein